MVVTAGEEIEETSGIAPSDERDGAVEDEEATSGMASSDERDGAVERMAQKERERR